MRGLRGVPKRALLWMIRFYRVSISPLHPGCCRFTPTCSQYAMEAVEKYGALKGAVSYTHLTLPTNREV